LRGGRPNAGSDDEAIAEIASGFLNPDPSCLIRSLLFPNLVWNPEPANLNQRFVAWRQMRSWLCGSIGDQMCIRRPYQFAGCGHMEMHVQRIVILYTLHPKTYSPASAQSSNSNRRLHQKIVRVLPSANIPREQHTPAMSVRACSRCPTQCASRFNVFLFHRRPRRQQRRQFRVRSCRHTVFCACAMLESITRTTARPIKGS